jgi:phosphate-selective porin OprO and OprP
MSSSFSIRSVIRLTALAAAIAALAPAAAPADPAAPPAADSAAAVPEGGPTLEDLDQKIAILERKLEIAEEAEQARKEAGSTAQGNRDGFLLKSNDGDFQIRWRGYVHADARYFPDDPDDRWANTFLLRRIRPIWEATAWKYYGLRIMTDFAGGSLAVLDAHVDLNFLPAANFRLGKFKAPIGLERLQSATDIALVERSYTTALVPNRDLGAQLHGSFREESYGYALAVLNGVPDGGNRETDSTDHKDFYARIFAQPFKQGSSEWVRNLGLGFAASWGVQKGDSTASALATVRSPAQLPIFSYRVRTAPRAAVAATPTAPAVTAESRDEGTVHAFGNSLRLNPHAYWYVGSFGLIGEYVSHAQEVRRGRFGEVAELTQQAWHVTASWFLTGEQGGFKTPKPRHPLAPVSADAARAAGEAGPGAPGNQGWGAFELVARVSRFQADEAAFGTFADPRASVSEALSYGVGLNWHLSRSVKWANNYEYTGFKDGAAATINGGDRLPEHVLFTRLQFVL